MKKSEFEFFTTIYGGDIKNVINSLCSNNNEFNREFLDIILKKYNLKVNIKNKRQLCSYLEKEIGTITFFTLYSEFWSNFISSFISTWTSNTYLRKILLKTKKLSRKLLFQYILIEGKKSNFKHLSKILAEEYSETDIPLVILENDLTYFLNFFSKMILELNNIIYGISFSFSKLFTKLNPGYWFSRKLKEEDLKIAIQLKEWFEKMNHYTSRLREELLNNPKYLKSLEVYESKKNREDMNKKWETTNLILVEALLKNKN